MKTKSMTGEDAEASSILILADGRMLARNVTPALAALLLSLQPGNQELALRARLSAPAPTHELSSQS